jgi:hypothetical protein
MIIHANVGNKHKSSKKITIMKRIFKIIFLVFFFITIGLISFRCKTDKIRIFGIDLFAYNNKLRVVQVYTRQTGLQFYADTQFHEIAYHQSSSSECLALTIAVAVTNPIDTNTMELYCNSNIIINSDTLFPATNLLLDERIARNIDRYEDKYGGYYFQFLDNDSFFSKLNFQYNNDSTFIFTFKAQTVDDIALIDSIKIKINWN